MQYLEGLECSTKFQALRRASHGSKCSPIIEIYQVENLPATAVTHSKFVFRLREFRSVSGGGDGETSFKISLNCLCFIRTS